MNICVRKHGPARDPGLLMVLAAAAFSRTLPKGSLGNLSQADWRGRRLISRGESPTGIRSLLPKDVKPIVDDMGTPGRGPGLREPEIMFIAHMDEIGLEVTEITRTARSGQSPRRLLLIHLWRA